MVPNNRTNRQRRWLVTQRLLFVGNGTNRLFAAPHHHGRNWEQTGRIAHIADMTVIVTTLSRLLPVE